MMKQHDYRRAVGSIRWSAAQRREIEDKLRDAMPEQTALPPDDDDPICIPHLQRLYEEQEARMKMERKQARMYLLILAAAMLMIGGTVAAVAWSSRKPNPENSQADEKVPEKNEKTDLEDDLVQAIIAPKLTDQQDEPDCRGISKTGKGFYFFGAESAQSDKSTGFEGYALRYYDEASGETVNVCAKPNCLHDGNEFCTSTTKMYSCMSDPVYLDGYVYAIAIDNREFLEKQEKCELYPTVLLRYKPDGTEITQLCVLNEDENVLPNECEMIAHRGQLWICCTYQRIYNTFDNNMEISSQDVGGKYDIFCYEPEKEKITTINTSGELQKDYRPFSVWGAELKGCGDYVYFHKFENDWRDKVKRSGVYRIDCSTGLIEQVVDIKSQKSMYYTVAGDYIYYTYLDRNYNAVHIYHIPTGKDTEINFETIAKEKASWFSSDMLDENKATLYVEKIVADAEHCYVFWQFEDRRHDLTDQPENTWMFNYVSELDTNGKLIKTVNFDDIKETVYPEPVTRDFLHSNGWYKTESTEDGEEYHRIAPDQLTDADYQDALSTSYKFQIDPWGKQIDYDGTDFYLKGGEIQYRISREELFGDMNIEALLVFRHYH